MNMYLVILCIVYLWICPMTNSGGLGTTPTGEVTTQRGHSGNKKEIEREQIHNK